ncbi:MAG: hypothetical protein Q7J32_17515 [Sphingomonadaceae bacterium]|nr:hypothetical protein [Sphingomonadaceae bacterium]
MRNLSRRTILGGATALPFITAAPAFAAFAVDRSTWNAAKAAYIAARDAGDSYWQSVEQPLDLSKMSVGERDQLAHVSDALLEAYIEAKDTLILTPAPDFAALLFKYDLVKDMCRDAMADSFAAFEADFARLAGTEANNG